MNAIDRLYGKNNYTIQKSVNLEDKLYTRLKDFLSKNFDATFSDIINICIEDLVSKDVQKYYAKPEGEITIYRSIMIRKSNLEALMKINRETGISVTRLINMAMKEFLEKYDK